MSSSTQDRYNMSMEFKDYLLQKYWEWEKTTGKRQSFSAFALYLGVKQSAFAHWIGGNIIPSRESIDRLAKKLGSEVYEAAGYSMPDPVLQVKGFPPEVIDALEEARLKIIASGIAGDPAASLDVIRETLKKVSVTSISKTQL